jgi:hypothetical protein
MTCDFSYIPPVGTITDFVWDSTAKTLTLTGTAFPVEADITNIDFAQSNCTISAATGTTITCILDDIETCGAWAPTLNAKLGSIPLDAALVKTEIIPCTVTAISPNTDLNILGYDNLTLTGTNFPRSIEGNEVIISI